MIDYIKHRRNFYQSLEHQSSIENASDMIKFNSVSEEQLDVANRLLSLKVSTHLAREICKTSFEKILSAKRKGL
jgi:hypothetical protein